MVWYKRKKVGITTATADKKEMPSGLWDKCSACKKVLESASLLENSYVCPHCAHHLRIGSKEYFSLFFDQNEFTELDAGLHSVDPLGFSDSKTYPERIKEAQQKTGFTDAIRCATGKMQGAALVIACMDFQFIGGSMGSVVGEKIARAIDYALANRMPFLLISKSGGARMMEAAFSLMQMAKTAAKLALLARAGLPYVSLLTDPTTGGVTASFAMLGDINIAEPGAMIGFAGPRIIKETIRKDLPKGFQLAEFVLEHGFLDFIETRQNMKERISTYLRLIAA